MENSVRTSMYVGVMLIVLISTTMILQGKTLAEEDIFYEVWYVALALQAGNALILGLYGRLRYKEYFVLAIATSAIATTNYGTVIGISLLGVLITAIVVLRWLINR